MHTRPSRTRLSSLAVLATLAVTSVTAQAAPGLDILVGGSPGTELGAELGGRPVALALASDGTVILASRQRDTSNLLRLDALGAAVGPMKRLPERVEHVAVDLKSGAILVIGDQSLSAFDRDLAPIWQQRLPARDEHEPARRVAVGELGTVAALAAGDVRVFSLEGLALGSIPARQNSVRDVAVLDGEGLVITTGSRSRRACGQDLDVAMLSAFEPGGAPRWDAYGEPGDDQLCGEHGDLLDSTRGVAVSRGEDGYIYLLAEVEGPRNILRGRPGAPGEPANNVGFDGMTDAETSQATLFTYFARFTPNGDHLRGQYLTLPDDGAIVQPAAIAADAHGNVHLTGTASHGPSAADEVARSEALDAFAGFYTVVEPDFEGRHLWRQFEDSAAATAVPALALAGGHAVTLLDVSSISSPASGTPGTFPGPMVLQWPADHGATAAEKRPERDSLGTFGYESGISGSDSSCYCDADSTPTPMSLLAIGVVGLALRRRQRRPC